MRLWEVEAAEAFVSEAPGLLALVPLMRGGARLKMIERAARAIERALPEEQSPDAETILLLLAGRHYNGEQLTSIMRRKQMIQLKQSSVYQMLAADDIAEAEAQGVAQGCCPRKARG